MQISSCEAIYLENTKTMKVFGVGLNKTGTTTLGKCLKALDYNHMSCRKDLLIKFRQDKLDEVLSEIDEYDSFEDWPYPLMYEQLFERYGTDAKFILTTRSSPEVWLHSLKKHSLRTLPGNHCRTLAYGVNYPFGNERKLMQIYKAHNGAVTDFFQKNCPNKFLTVCWEEGDGWAEICRFLECDVPETPFPHENKGVMRRDFKGKLREYNNRFRAGYFGRLS